MPTSVDDDGLELQNILSSRKRWYFKK